MLFYLSCNHTLWTHIFIMDEDENEDEYMCCVCDSFAVYDLDYIEACRTCYGVVYCQDDSKILFGCVCSNGRYNYNYEPWCFKCWSLCNKKQQIVFERENTKKDKRRIKLQKDLTKYNLQLRNDSKLCEMYINKKMFMPSFPTRKKIARRMAQLHFLYSYTSYQYYIQYYKSKGYSSRESCDEAEAYALDISNGFPVVWPWQVKARRRLYMTLFVRIIPKIIAWRKRATQTVFHPQNMRFDVEIE